MVADIEKRTVLGSRAGFTVVELLIVVATLTVLAAVLLPKVVSLSEKRKAMRDLVTINRIVEGLGKFYEDCGTYPTEAKGLVAVDGSNTLNGSDMTNCWHGPYIDNQLVPGSATDIQGAFGTADHITLHISAANGDKNGNGNTNDYYIEVTGVPEAMAEYLEAKIDSDSPKDSSANPSTTGKWTYTCNGGTCTCDYIFREM